MLMSSALFWDITQRRVLVLYRRFGTTYRSRLQGSSSTKKHTLEDGTETSVKDNPSTLRNIPEECNLISEVLTAVS
jgi:hypothetical protein